MGKNMIYQAMKEIARSKGIKASPQNDLYKMYPPYFLNAFYYDIVDKKAKKLDMHIDYEAKCSYFDDLKVHIIEPDSALKLTDKVRANSVIRFRSALAREVIEFGFDGSDEAYTDIAEKTFEHIENWYKEFFSKVRTDHGDLEEYFIKNRDEFPMQAAFVYIRQEKYDLAEKCINMLPPKLNSSRTVVPKTHEQELRLKASNAEAFGDCYMRDDMDCIIDYIISGKNGLEWTAARALYGLTAEERSPK